MGDVKASTGSRGYLAPKGSVPCGAQTHDLPQKGNSHLPTVLNSGCQSNFT